MFNRILKYLMSFYLEEYDKNKKTSLQKLSISQKGLNLIKGFEGFVPSTYLCPAGIPTVGYGYTGIYKDKKLNINNKITITKKEAEKLLEESIVKYENSVKKYINVDLNQNQFDALVSFTYNLGGNALKKSTLRKVLNKNSYDEVSNQLKRWVYSNGEKSEGLIRRRQVEADLFDSEN